MTYSAMAKDIETFIQQTSSSKVSFLGKTCFALNGVPANISEVGLWLIGHSFGGRIGLLLALMRPDLFDRLIVVDASPFVNKKSIKVGIFQETARKGGAVAEIIILCSKDSSGVDVKSTYL